MGRCVCDICYKVFQNKGALATHKSFKHPIKTIKQLLPSNPSYKYLRKKMKSQNDENESKSSSVNILIIFIFPSNIHFDFLSFNPNLNQLK